MNLRTATPEDAQALQRLINEAFNRIDAGYIDESHFNNPNIHSLIAEENNILLGTASLHIITKLDRKMGQIEDVVVAPNARGKGVGKVLVQGLLALSTEKKCYKVILNTNDQNIPFYEKLGFVKGENQMVIRN